MSTTYQRHAVPDQYLRKWQRTVDLLATIFHVPAGLIMRVASSEIEVLISSHTDKNPYEPEEKADLGTGLYCETVMMRRALLEVPNALDDADWRHNPDIELGMISYLGVPLVWPDGEVFGTICVLDDKTRAFSDLYKSLIWEFKGIIENDFIVIHQTQELEREVVAHKEAEEALQRSHDELLSRVREHASLLAHSEAELQKEVRERGRAEAREEHQAEVLRAIRTIGQLIVSEDDRDRLIQRTCSFLAESTSFVHAWVALVDGSGRVTSMAQDGLNGTATVFMDHLRHGSPHCFGKACEQPEMVSVTKNEPSCAGCPLASSQFGFEAAAVRLEHAGQTYGVLGVSVPGDFVWDEEERALLTELAGDVAFALHGLDQHAKTLQAEKERELLSSAVSHTAESVVITDAAATILYVNPAFLESTGYQRVDVIGRNPRILKSGSHGPAFYQEMWGTLRKGEVWRGELTNRRKDGSLYTEEATISPIVDSEGNVTNYIGVKRDVTKQRLLQRQLRQAQKMEAIGTLAGGIAHDFNNILGAIVGYADLALNGKKRGPAQQEKALRTILQAGERASELVAQVLAFGRRTEVERVPVRVESILKEALKLLRGALPATVEIRRNIRGEGSVVMADPTQIHQVIMNLCTNAWHAMREGGTLDIGLQTVDIDAKSASWKVDVASGSYVQLTVTDTGHGIPAKNLDRIFDPFFTTKKLGEGTGMGLAAVHDIVKSHSGAILVESTVGQGTTFTVLLPTVDMPGRVQKLDTGPLPGGNERVLVVDDEDPLLDIHASFLLPMGYMVTTRHNGVEAWETFRAAPDSYDVIITDLNMPKMTGVELAGRVLGLRPDLPIILCTGYSDRFTSEQVEGVGIRGVLAKPLRQQTLLRTLRRVLDDGRPPADSDS